MAQGALAHRLQRRNACNAVPTAKSKMVARGPQNGRGGLERCLPLDFGHSKQLSLNKFFDPSTPSMRKGRDRGYGKKEKTGDYSGHYVIASSRPPER